MEFVLIESTKAGRSASLTGSSPVRTGVLLTAALLCATGSIPATAQQPQVPTPPSWVPSRSQSAQGPVAVLQVRDNVYLLVADGSNITAQVGPDGVLLVDTSTGKLNDEIVLAIQQLSDQPIRWIINTHVHADHTGGNAALFRAGRSTPQNRFASGLGFPGSLPTGATIVAHESVLFRMSGLTGQTTPTPQDSWPVATFFGESKELYLNGEAIQVLHQAPAHTDGDSIVVFRHADIVSTGDLFNSTSYPVIDLKTGGTIDGVIDALNSIIDVTFPREKAEGGTYVIPGHGRISDEADVVIYRNMVTILRDRIRDLMQKGMTLDQVKAAKPTADYDPRWATTSWTGDMFVEAVYRTLTPSTTSPSTPQGSNR
ncbi:MAG: MBL fold metallo-hydrolase [Vicinamibacterales bacterium]